MDSRTARTFHLAEAGIHQALWGLNQPSGWLIYDGQDGISLPGGFVDVAISPDPSQRGVFTDTVTVMATGYLPGPAGSQRSPCTVRVITHKDPRYFAYALFGNDQVTVGNGTVQVMADSYTSDDGGYGGANVTENADIATNSTAAGAVTILPQGEVHGNISVGAGAEFPELSVDNNGLVTGTITALDGPNVLPSITTIPAGLTELGDVWPDGSAELVPAEGRYHMTDLDIFGSATIVCNGQVIIYIDMAADGATPDVRIGGSGIVNTSTDPANLIIYCLQDVVSVTISGTAALYGAIYAPNADVVFNAGEVYGSLVGKTVTMNGANAHLHSDEALRDHANPRALMRSWEVL